MPSEPAEYVMAYSDQDGKPLVDTHGAYNIEDSSYTVPVSGIYTITVSDVNSINGSTSVQKYVTAGEVIIHTTAWTPYEFGYYRREGNMWDILIQKDAYLDLPLESVVPRTVVVTAAMKVLFTSHTSTELDYTGKIRVLLPIVGFSET